MFAFLTGVEAVRSLARPIRLTARIRTETGRSKGDGGSRRRLYSAAEMFFEESNKN
jgi:hypothetical protein